MHADAGPRGRERTTHATTRPAPPVPAWPQLEPRHAARLLEHVRAWQRRLAGAIDRHYDPRAYDVAPELHAVVDRMSDDLVRVFGDVGLTAPVRTGLEAHERRAGPLTLRLMPLPATGSAPMPVHTIDPDHAYSVMTGWAAWLEDRAAAAPAPGSDGAQADRRSDDPRLDVFLPASAFDGNGMRVDRGTLKRWESEGRVRYQDNGKLDGRRRVDYLVRDVIRQLRPTSEQLAAWLAGLPR
jgi:hypothetical protein